METATMAPEAEQAPQPTATDMRKWHAPRRVQHDPRDVTATLSIPTLPEGLELPAGLDERHAELWERADLFGRAVQRLGEEYGSLLAAKKPFSAAVAWADRRASLWRDEAQLRRDLCDLVTPVRAAITAEMVALSEIDGHELKKAVKTLVAAGFTARGDLEPVTSPEREARHDRIATLRAAGHRWDEAGDRAAVSNCEGSLRAWVGEGIKSLVGNL